MNQNAAPRDNAIEVTKFLMVLLVVALHQRYSPEQRHQLTLLINGLYRIAVPFFFITTGYYLRPGRIEQYQWRVLRLYLIWLPIYLLPALWIIKVNNPGRLLTEVLLGPWHLWFLVSVFLGLFVVRWTAGLAPYRRVILAAALFLTGWVLERGCQFVYLHAQGGVVSNHLWRNFLVDGAPFLMLGVLLGLAKGDFPRPVVGLALAFAGLCLVLLEAFLFSSFDSLGLYPDPDLLLGTPLVGAGLVIALRGKRLAQLDSVKPGRVAAGIYFSHFGIMVVVQHFYPLIPLALLLAICVAVGAAIAHVPQLRWLC